VNRGQGELLGSGAYGRVYQALNFMTGQLMAVKQVTVHQIHACPVWRTVNSRPAVLFHQVPVQSHLLSSGHDRRVQALQREMEVLASMSNEHIVQYYGMQYEADVVNIVRVFVFRFCAHCFAVYVLHVVPLTTVPGVCSWRFNCLAVEALRQVQRKAGSRLHKANSIGLT